MKNYASALLMAAILLPCCMLLGRGVRHASHFALPSLATNDSIHPQPEALRSVVPSPLTGVYLPTVELQQTAQRLHGVVGCETVVPAPDGSLTLVDKWNRVFRAAPTMGSGGGSAGNGRGQDGTGAALRGWTLTPHPRISSLGSGRMLGGAYDAQGNLVFADAVRA
jgi:hypothetical protein